MSRPTFVQYSLGKCTHITHKPCLLGQNDTLPCILICEIVWITVDDKIISTVFVKTIIEIEHAKAK